MTGGERKALPEGPAGPSANARAACDGRTAEGPLPYEGLPSGANADGASGSMESGPGVRVAFTFDEDMRVAAAGFETCSFPEARPVASRLCGALLGTTLDQASALNLPDLAATAGLPGPTPAVRAVHFAKSAALLPWLGRRARHGAAITCTCFHVATETIVAAIRERGLRTADDVRDATKAGSGCGSCRPDVERLLAAAAARRRS